MTLVSSPPVSSSTAAAAASAAGSAWVAVCRLGDLEVERGRAALLGDTQIALFLLHGSGGSDGRVHAVQNLDPYSGAHVISRGIVGTRQDAPTVASPMYKQVFDLRTGACLDAKGKEPLALRTWPTAVDGDTVLVRWSGPARGAEPASASGPARGKEAR